MNEGEPVDVEHDHGSEPVQTLSFVAVPSTLLLCRVRISKCRNHSWPDLCYRCVHALDIEIASNLLLYHLWFNNHSFIYLKCHYA